MKAANRLRRIAWYGIHCMIPAEYQPALIERNYLLFERDGKAVFEVKWQKSGSKVNPERIIESLAEENAHFIVKPSLMEFLSDKKTDAVFAPCCDVETLSHGCSRDAQAMITALSPCFTSYPFLWETMDTISRGAVLVCSQCNCVSTIQFFETRGIQNKERESDFSNAGTCSNSDSIRNAVLSSFCDHKTSPSASCIWALFDIQAIIPFYYTLEKYRFYPGHFFMKFRYKNIILTLHRLSPASFLLDKTVLPLFIESHFKLCTEKFNRVFVKNKGVDSVQYTKKSFSLGWNRRFLNFKRNFGKQEISLCRAWHLPDKNRILVVASESGAEVDLNEFEEICSSYKII